MYITLSSPCTVDLFNNNDNMEKVQWARKWSPDDLDIALAYRPPGSLLLEAVDELPTESNLAPPN